MNDVIVPQSQKLLYVSQSFTVALSQSSHAYLSTLQGLQWSLLKEEEVIPHILAMEGRRGRPPNSERQLASESAKASRRRKGRPPNVTDPLAAEGPSPSDVKLLRKLEAQGLHLILTFL